MTVSFMLLRRSSGEPEGDRETVTEEVALLAATAAGRRGLEDDMAGGAALLFWSALCVSLSLGDLVESQVHWAASMRGKDDCPVRKDVVTARKPKFPRLLKGGVRVSRPQSLKCYLSSRNDVVGV